MEYHRFRPRPLSDGGPNRARMNTTEKHYADCCCPDCCHRRMAQELDDIKTWGIVAVIAAIIWIFLS